MLGCFSGQRRVVTDESCTNGTRGSMNFTASGPEPVSQSECVFMPVLCVTKHCQFVSVLMAEQEISRGRSHMQVFVIHQELKPWIRSSEGVMTSGSSRACLRVAVLTFMLTR